MTGETAPPSVLLNNRYRLDREIGRGGFGIVYLARDEQLLGRPVVVKVLRETRVSEDVAAWQRMKFSQEFEALARIDHPGVVGLLDLGTTPEGNPFVVMQYVHGRSLRAVLETERISLDRVGSIVRQVGHAIAAAHAQGVVHRDLKPENILLQATGDGVEYVKVIDFGIAKVEHSRMRTGATATDFVVGTTAYMAPEQLVVEPVTSAVDVYALGVIAYEMVTGRVPFGAATPALQYQMLRTGEATDPASLRPELPEDVGKAIRKALSFLPAGRQARIDDFGEEVARGLEGTAGGGEARIPVRERTAVYAPSAAPDTSPELEEAVGGAVPLDSRLYVVRPADAALVSALARQDSIVLIKGARQVGKTSLLARGVQWAREQGRRVALTDFQKLNTSDLQSTETLYFALLDRICDQLGLESDPGRAWDPKRAPNVNLERFLRREVLDASLPPLLWALDEADRLFACPFSNDVFGLFRSWHNERSLDPSGPWRRLTMGISYATEAHLFISDLNQSPFNVGTRIALGDFTQAEVEELNERHGRPLRDADEVRRFYGLVGGQPFLVRRGLHALTSERTTLERLEDMAADLEGPFGDHLRRLLVSLNQEPVLAKAVQGILRGRTSLSTEAFYRLRSAGLVGGESTRAVRMRCSLYGEFLRRHMK